MKVDIECAFIDNALLLSSATHFIEIFDIYRKYVLWKYAKTLHDSWYLFSEFLHSLSAAYGHRIFTA